MDRRRIELQIRAVMVPYRIERRRRNTPIMEQFRERARVLLDGLEQHVRPYRDLEERLDEARRELGSEADHRA